MLRNLQRCWPSAAGSGPLWRPCATVAATGAQQQPIKYTDTINLPRTKFPARLTAAKRTEVERRINETCFAPLYQWQRQHLNNDDGAAEFVLHDGPPYANGDLHMGHALNKILKDIILRQHIISGRRVHYRPGWDCHGLPIELKALGSGAPSTAAATEAHGTPPATDALQIRRRARAFAAATADRQREAFASWGVVADWRAAATDWRAAATDARYRTMDTAYVCNQLRRFQQLHAAGFVYRAQKPVFWSPSSRTALAEAELEYDERHRSASLTLRLRLTHVGERLETLLHGTQLGASNRRLFALVWTTTPWSLPANQAVCVNAALDYSVVQLDGHAPDDLYVVASDRVAHIGVAVSAVVASCRGADLIGCRYQHPIDSASTDLPIVAGAHVQATKGTGLVHTAPAHGPDDFLVALEHRWPVRSLVDEAGVYTPEAPAFLRGHICLGAGDRLVLQHCGADVVHLGEIEHSYPIDWRTKQPVLLRASQQWFIDTERIKDAAIEAIAAVAVYPARGAAANTANLVGQLRRRPYWCISRQRCWGTPLPVFYERRSGAEIVDARCVEHLCGLMQELEPDGTEAGADVWWRLPVERLVPADVLAERGLTAADVRRGDDILDIWFDSGCSWSYAVEPAAAAEGHRRVADLYLEGHDQFTGWFQSSLMTSVALQRCAPYRGLFVHGFAVDARGAKMSKSLGNVIAPADVTGRYGVDALRWWVAAHGSAGTAVPVGAATLQPSAECVQRVRTTLRYLVGGVATTAASADVVAPLRHVDRRFLAAVRRFDAAVRRAHAEHQYQRATAAIVHFVTNDLSAEYLHVIKDRLYCGGAAEHRALQAVLRRALCSLCTAVWPIAPFVVEECWSYVDADVIGDRRTFYEWAVANGAADESSSSSSAAPEADDDGGLFDVVLRLKQQLQLAVGDRNAWSLHARVSAPAALVGNLLALHPAERRAVCDSELCEVLQVGAVTLVTDNEQAMGDGFAIETERIEGALCARCRRFSVPATAAAVCERCAGVLQEKGAQ